MNKSGKFSTKSVYKWLGKPLAGAHNGWMWKAPIPLKIKIHMWKLFRNAILTRDNLKKRKWTGNPLCSFCNVPENAQHLFFECGIAKSVWGSIGKVIGASNCPRNLWQSFAWLYAFLPGGHRFYMLCIAAVCWGVWIL